MGFLRWLGKNLGTLITAFILALVVWVSAVTAADPNQEMSYPRQVPIEVMGKDANLLLVSNLPTNVQVTLNAPRSIWTQLTGDENAVRAWVNLANLGAGEHVLPVNVQVRPDIRPVRVVSRDPSDVRLVLEPMVTRNFTVTLSVEGAPIPGYESGDPVIQPEQVTLSGAESRVSLVKEVHADLNILNASQSIEKQVKLIALDANGDSVDGITLTPDSVTISQPISLSVGYRNVIVRLVTVGQVANGYKLTNEVVTPPSVIVYANNPSLLNNLPGYVETKPVDLTGLESYLETLVELNLPVGISVLNDQKVLVQVSVAPIETNLTVTLPVELIGIKPGLIALSAPTTVDAILSGPVPVLSKLKPSDIRVVIDLTGKDLGTYQLAPSIAFLPDKVTSQSILPSPIEVTILKAPTPTHTVTPGASATPSPKP